MAESKQENKNDGYGIDDVERWEEERRIAEEKEKKKLRYKLKQLRCEWKQQPLLNKIYTISISISLILSVYSFVSPLLKPHPDIYVIGGKELITTIGSEYASGTFKSKIKEMLRQKTWS